MRTKKPPLFWDSLIVLCNMAGARGNILLYWLTGFSTITMVTLAVVCIDVFYIFIRFSRKSSKKKIKFPPAVILIFCILVINGINALLDGDSIFFLIEYLAFAVLFSYILGRLSSEYIVYHFTDSPILLSRGYIYESLISIVGVIISFILLLFIGPRKVPIDVDFLRSNMDAGAMYYRSYFSVIIETFTLRVPFFQNQGILCGLFHEPHILTQNIFPCFILMLGISRKKIQKWAVVITAILMILFTGSATNIIVTAICLVAFSILNIRAHKIGTIFGLVIIVLAGMLYVSYDDTLFQFFLGRLDSDNYSQNYSMALLKWAFSPRTLLGSNFLSTEYVEDVMFSSIIKDVGFVPCILNTAFLLLYIKNIIKLVATKDNMAKAVAFASLYYILHSAKIGMTMYMQTLPIMLVFLQTIVLNKFSNGRVRIIR